MMFKNNILIFTLVLVSLIFVDCKKKKTVQEEAETSFDKSAMLGNYSNNIIIPAFQSFKTSVDSLLISFNAFSQSKNIKTLSDLRRNYTNAYLKFQSVSSFEFGPSESENVRTNFNTYPLDADQVNSNIQTGSYNLGTVDNIDAKGFPAIDYLLFGKNETDQSLVKKFDTDPFAVNTTAYLAACINEVQSKTNSILTAWNSTYRTTFVNSTGSQIGSSLAMLINQLNFEIDLLKNNKLGIPLGKKSLGTKLPEKCEAYYANNISVKLAKACLLNIENVYLGRSASDADGLGIDDYLQQLDAKHGSETLNDAIKKQFAVAKSKLELVDEPLASSILNNAPAVDAAYLEIVKLLVLLKTDTPSALGIIITYQDGDGD